MSEDDGVDWIESMLMAISGVELSPGLIGAMLCASAIVEVVAIVAIVRWMNGGEEQSAANAVATLRGWIPEPYRANSRSVKSAGDGCDAIEWDEAGRRVQLFEVEVNSEMSSMTRLTITVSFAGDTGRMERMLRKTKEPACVHSYAVHGGFVRARLRRVRKGRENSRKVIDWLLVNMPEGEKRL